MNSFKGFTKTIEMYLQQLAEYDELFAAKYANPAKSIDECCNYILNVVMKSAKQGCIGCTDDEIYSLAVHYYEEDIKDIKNVSKSVQIVSNNEIELTEEEKAEARKDALKEYQKQEMLKIQAKAAAKTKVKSESNNNIQPSLFD